MSHPLNPDFARRRATMTSTHSSGHYANDNDCRLCILNYDEATGRKFVKYLRNAYMRQSWSKNSRYLGHFRWMIRRVRHPKKLKFDKDLKCRPRDLRKTNSVDILIQKSILLIFWSQDSKNS